jgi:hypothetical protein
MLKDDVADKLPEVPRSIGESFINRCTVTLFHLPVYRTWWPRFL